MRRSMTSPVRRWSPSHGTLRYHDICCNGYFVVSLTTSGDTSPSSGLAVARFPVADASGNYHYVSDFEVGVDIPASVADHLADFHVVSHGIDTNHNGSYDFSRGPSDLDPSLPQEATVPPSCGLIER